MAEIWVAACGGMLAGEPLAAAEGSAGSAASCGSTRGLLRIHTYCMMSLGAMIGGSPERAVGLIRLAAGVTRDPDPGALAPLFDRLGPALAAGAADMAEATDPISARRGSGAGLHEHGGRRHRAAAARLIQRVIYP